MARFKYFTDAEVVGLHPELVDRLDRARELAGVPFVITSGLRTKEQNAAVGGKPNSAHLYGLAVDLRAANSYFRFKIVQGLLFAGFNRIVVYRSDGHVHADVSLTLPQNVFVVEE